MQDLPPLAGFDPSFRSPCWYDEAAEQLNKFVASSDATAASQASQRRLQRGGSGAISPARLRCVPAFYILGGFHSFANSLQKCLEAHPDVVFDAASRMQFWGEPERPASAFIQGFSTAAEAVRYVAAHIHVLVVGSSMAFV